ncbi:MAG: N-acetylmuramic acid 6-phosphate etherase [Tissierellaceae bacterium]
MKEIITESRNELSKDIDCLSTIDILKIINNEDKKIALAVEKQLDSIARAVDGIFDRISSGGRLIYIGAGTSGRLGILDASECPPTFGTDPGLVKAIIAGGKEAFTVAIEGAEDDELGGVRDLKEISLTSKDALVGITARGNTPYVLGAISYAKEIGALTVGINNNPGSALEEISHISITPVVGAEVIAGSTRMKAGTSQKMILNMISTATMIKWGKVYGNLMVDVKASNNKLEKRAEIIVMEATGVSQKEAVRALEETDYDCKLSIFMLISQLGKLEAASILEENGGYLRKALSAASVK